MRAGAAEGGFTLIEIMVVLIIVGLLAALAVFSLGDSSRQRELENEVRELYLLMQTASEQAVVNNREMGLQFQEDGYQFVAYQDDDASWASSGERLFRLRTLPEWLTVTKFIENDTPKLASAKDELLPDIVFFSSGETTPFEIEFTIDGNSDYVHVIASDGVSPMVWRKPGDDGEEP